jgi:hypothetical protein
MAMNDIEKFQNTIDVLTRKREACVNRGRELADERSVIALEAHTGNVKASKRLQEVNAALAVRASELESFDVALKAAGEKLAAAQAAEAAAADRQLAEEAKKLTRELGECFPYLDRHLAEAARALIAIHDGIAKLHQAGFQFPSDNQVQAWHHCGNPDLGAPASTILARSTA